MRIFDTKVQHLKYLVLREVARLAWQDELQEKMLSIPEKICPGPQPTMRCCIYKERAIVIERIKLAMGGDKSNANVIETLSIACDECPQGGYDVTQDCRGCLAHRCMDACPKGAITLGDNYVAHIDKSKCVNCGKCASVCPYNAIANHLRPCEKACKVNAISMDENQAAKIDNNKCVSCGACVYMCPWGAIMDKSFILDVIQMIKESKANNSKVYAIIAPSISSQFSYAKLGQVVTGMKELGFQDVIEVALGADMVAKEEAIELSEKGFLTSSCCPAFVSLIEKHYPELKTKISSHMSPAGVLASYIKKMEPTSKIVFVGPCTAKKMEFQRENYHGCIDSVITFEELQALFDSKDLEIAELAEGQLDNASYFGRIFARSGGLTEAVAESLEEQNVNDFVAKPVVCNGIEECKLALLKASKGVLDANFIEGMACVGGCINGPCALSHGVRSKIDVDAYAKSAHEKKILDAVNSVKI